MNGSGIHTANTNATQVVRVVDGNALHSKRSVNINIWSWKAINNHVKKWEHVVVVIIWIKASVTINARSKDDVLHGELKLLISCAEVHHQIKRIVNNSLWTSAVTVNLVDNHHDGKACVDSVAQNKASLWHRALGCVNQEKRTVSHLQNALNLAAKVSVARGINNVDLNALVLNRDILCQNGNSALDAGAPVLVISQFTLYGDTRKGRRPSWAHAAPGEEAEPLVDAVVADLRGRGLHVETGQFGAMMEVSLVNDGPFTVLVEA